MAHKLKIVLQHTEPKIYRTVIVPENFTFDELHLVIQCVMNWDNSHLYMFNLGAPYASDIIMPQYGEDDDNFGFDSRFEEHDALETYLSDFFNGHQKKMTYTYDFGDDWKHIITPLKKPTEEVMYPKCVKGENAAPIEDCGGIYGFYDILEIMNKKKKNSEEKEMLEWYALSGVKKYEDMFGFDIDKVNQRLLEVFTN